jgi:hypothetical protein
MSGFELREEASLLSKPRAAVPSVTPCNVWFNPFAQTCIQSFDSLGDNRLEDFRYLKTTNDSPEKDGNMESA